MQYRRIDRADLQFDVSRIAKLLGERNILPAEFRRSHIHRVEVAGSPAIQQARLGFEGTLGLAAGFEQTARHATHAVAAGGRFRAVIVVDTDESLSAGK